MRLAIAGAFLALCGVLALLWWTTAHPARVAANPEAPAVTEDVPPPARDVTPPNMIPGPKIDGPLTRVAVPDPPPPPPRWRRFFLPVVEEAGLLGVGQRKVRVEGIAPLAADATCEGGETPSWNCGRAAITALQRLIRGRAIECLVSATDGGDGFTAPCRVGSFDIALWLATTGWGKPDTGAAEAIAKAAAIARCAGRGLWRGAVPADCPDPQSTGATVPAPSPVH